MTVSKKLTHCGLVMPYGDIELGQHWFIGLLLEGTKPLPEPMSSGSSGIHWSVILQEIPQPPVNEIDWKITAFTGV